MSTLNVNPISAALPGVGRTVERALRALVAFHAVWEGRRAAAALAQLDGRMLQDIGLSRTEVVGAIEQPLLSDPTAHLASAVRARRAGDAAQRREAARAWAA